MFVISLGGMSELVQLGLAERAEAVLHEERWGIMALYLHSGHGRACQI
jgi:hypothetical protein